MKGPRARFALAAASIAMTVVAVEIVCRVLAIDVSGRATAFEKQAIFYRQPTLPVGSVFFRRPGPATFRGNVLAAELQGL